MKIDNTLNSLTGVRGKGSVAVKGKSQVSRVRTLAAYTTASI